MVSNSWLYVNNWMDEEVILLYYNKRNG